MTTLDEYKAQRAELIASERALRFDAQTIANATDKEKHAVEIVSALRTKEAQEIWNADAEKLMYPGMEFLTAKKTILGTKLYQVVKKLPKGGLLHGHMDAMCDAKFLLQSALEYPQMHIRIDTVITSSLSLPLPQFKPLTADLCAQYANAPSLTSPEYVPGSWVPLSKARNEFAHGGSEAFDNWVVGSMMINPKEAYVDYNTSVKIWEKFATTFRVAGGMIRYEPVMKQYMRQVMLSSIEDGISYIELRINFFYKLGIREDGAETLGHQDYLRLLGEVIQEVKGKMKAENRKDEFIGAKVIYTTLRFIDNQELLWYLEDCMTLKKEFPDLIAGFDLVAQEDTNKPLIYYIESLLWFQEESKKRGLDIPFIFHAGETLDDGGAADSNLYDALLLGTKRIGHGFSLAKHPLLMKMCKERGVAIEVCPISNEILRLTSSMPMHPLPVLLNNGVSVALCPDDPSVFGNMGLSFDFFQVIVASEVTNILSLKQLARQSLEHSSLDVEDKKRAVEIWEKRWNAYIEEIVSSKTA
ncbi:adenosine deaminase-related growth factor [Rhizoctonia solani AG-3 Rhs1AP]|uniref:adenosine deaminase n=1 Tax=Rhizoctonia solani AG-3 Rhs1AP TaxID=1086054 RepID=X8JIY7_9AGAM|nr:adenosine deaminase-related growth factor [Rhizoctonia solani AG-3 Rhs1AP]